MITFKNFLDAPVEAVALGYNPTIIDTIALVCSWISRRGVKSVLAEWAELKDFQLKYVPKHFFIALFNTFLFISLPLFFWVYALAIHSQLKPMAKELKEEIRRIEEDLSL